MNKRLVLLLFVGLMFLSANLVSAGSWYDNRYGNYGCDYSYGYSSYGDCYRTETFRDTTENKHTTVLTSRDRYTTQRIKTVTTSYTDIERETKTPVYYSHGPSYRSYSYGPRYRYSDYRYSYNVPGYVSSPDYYYVRW